MNFYKSLYKKNLCHSITDSIIYNVVLRSHTYYETPLVIHTNLRDSVSGYCNSR